MSNTFFQFKQFLINQEQSGMKVTTDGCLFGGWVASILKETEPKRILDIGTGTGILSLMLAQVSADAQITALEINKNAFEEATDNFKKSNWSDRLTCINKALQEFKTEEKYDLIICNPPFFKSNQKGINSNKNQALHSDHLSTEELIDGILRLLNLNGRAFILYPEREMNQFSTEAKKHGLYVNKKVTVRNKIDSDVFRVMAVFSFSEREEIKEEIIIRDEHGHYTKPFWNLVNEYYL